MNDQNRTTHLSQTPGKVVIARSGQRMKHGSIARALDFKETPRVMLLVESVGRQTWNTLLEPPELGHKAKSTIPL